MLCCDHAVVKFGRSSCCVVTMVSAMAMVSGVREELVESGRSSCCVVAMVNGVWEELLLCCDDMEIMDMMHGQWSLGGESCPLLQLHE